MPKVSIIMPVFNPQAAYLRQSIESILKQDFLDLELILVADGSKDETQQILKKYADSDKRIRILRNGDNIGLTRSLNIAIKETRGEFIARMDDDDISLPSRIKEEIKYIEREGLDFIGSDCDFIDEWNKLLKKKRIIFPANLKKRMMKGNFFTHSTFFGRKKVFNELYDENFKKAQDYEFLLRIIFKGFKIGYLNKALLLYRVNSKSISAKNAKEQEWCAIRARWKALFSMKYPKIYAVYFLRAFLSFLIPYDLKRFIIYRLLK